MNRKDFILNCSMTCLGAIIVAPMLNGCAGTKYLSANIEDNNLIVPLSSFETLQNGTTQYRRYVVVEHETLNFPICIYRFDAHSYQALWMQCTHQGTELQVFGDSLQCPAHGSEFANTGAVRNGPAADPLRRFAVDIHKTILKISLR
jgi:Rieske Fe-S protein